MMNMESTIDASDAPDAPENTVAAAIARVSATAAVATANATETEIEVETAAATTTTTATATATETKQQGAGTEEVQVAELVNENENENVNENTSGNENTDENENEISNNQGEAVTEAVTEARAIHENETEAEMEMEMEEDNDDNNAKNNDNEHETEMEAEAEAETVTITETDHPEIIFPDNTFEDALLISDFLTIYHCDYCVHKKHLTKRGMSDNKQNSKGSTSTSTSSDSLYDDGTSNDKTDTNTNKSRRQSPSTFLGYGGGTNFISPRDLISSISYRRDIEKYHYVSSLLSSYNHTHNNKHNLATSISSETKSKLENLLRDEEQKIWERKQNRIVTGRMSRDEDAVKLVSNFEVWATKLIATEMLLCRPSSGEVARGKVPSCSTLLNMASGDYLTWAMPPCKFDVDGDQNDNGDNDNGNGKDDSNDDKVGASTRGSSGLNEQEDDEVEIINVTTPNTKPGRQSSTSSQKSPIAASSPSRQKNDKNKGTQYRGTLGIPPNSLTWKEYLRISIMVSSLQSKKAIQQASKSTLTNSIYTQPTEGFDPKNPTILKAFSSKRSTSQSEIVSRHTPADLVALWVRAQRNTGAFLHLIDLFTIDFIQEDNGDGGDNDDNDDEYLPRTRNGSDEEMEDLQHENQNKHKNEHENEHDVHHIDDQNSNKNNRRRNRKMEQPIHLTGKPIATYVGNHKKIKVRIEKEAMLLDKLMNWAVTNQILFTHEPMRDALLKQKKKEINFKKRRAADLGRGVGTKKRKYNSGGGGGGSSGGSASATSANNVMNTDPKVIVAAKMYILRWFARRNRGILASLFSNESNAEPHQYSSNRESRLASINLPKEVKKFLVINRDGSTDRTLARIDRRIPLKTLKEGFEYAISSILTALRSAIPDDSALVRDINIAESDFELLCTEFLGESPSALLNNVDTIGIDAYYKQLQTLPPPWSERCSICQDEKKGQNDVKKMCWNCGMSFHSQCDKGKALLIPKPIAECQTLSSLYWSPSFASDLPEMPDFDNGKGNITWTEMVLTLRRGSLGSPWGVRLYNVEHCISSLQETEAWLENGYDIRPLLRQTRDPPLRLPLIGMIAYEVHGSMPGERAGLKRGDVITAVKVAQSSDPNAESSQQHFFKNMNEQERMKIFKEQTLSIELTVNRPSTDIVEMSEKFKNAVGKVIKTVIDKHEMNMSERWYCEKCIQTNYTTEGNTDNHIAHDAKLCQAVLRRIGMEWCSLPFHDEEIPPTINTDTDDNSKEIDLTNDDKDNQSWHAKHVSLRRIHEMMDYVIAKAQGKPLSSNSSPFVVPPWDKDRGAKLSWSDGLQDQPFHLLCRGMGLIVNRKWESNCFQEHQSELRMRFIKLFVSWCLDSTDKELSERQTCGPPPVAFNAVTPWLFQGCSICKVRRVSTKEESCVCDSVECEKINQKRTFAHSKASTEGDKQNDNDEGQIEYSLFTDQLQYDYYSSFVGTTILVSPDDPILKSFEQKSKVKVEAMNGPFVLVVVSYLPSAFVTKEANIGIVTEVPALSSEESEESGLFHLIPLISDKQLKFVLGGCQMRKRDKFDRSWFHLEVLSLAGIIVLTPAELMRRVSASKKIITAIEERIYSLSFNANELNEKTSSALISSQTHRPVNPYCSTLLRRYNSCFQDDDYDPTTILTTLGGTVSVPKNTELVSTIQILVLVNETLFAKSDLFQILNFPEREKIPLVDSDEEEVEEINGNTESHRSSHGQPSATEKYFPRRNLAFLHGLVLFRNIDAVTEGFCSLCYSDLLYWGIPNDRRAFWTEKRCKAMKQIEEIVSKQTLLRPLTLHESDKVESLQLILSRLDKEGDSYGESEGDNQVKYNGVGWGIELLRWNGDKGKIRVGRVVPNSPAAKAGFRPHDIVVTINGNPIRSIQSFEKLSQHLLGIHQQESSPTTFQDKEYPSVSTLYHLDQAVMGPVVVCINRYNYDGQKPASQQAVQPEPPHQYSPLAQPQRLQQQHEIQEHQPSYNNEGYQVVQNPLSQIDHQVHMPANMPAQPSLDESLHNVNANAAQRVYFDQSHLYSLGVNQSFLSLTEIAVLICAIERKQPKLGLRLLSPSYSSSIVVQEYREKITPFIKQNNVAAIPKLTEEQWRTLLRADWERSLEETGEVVHKEGGFEYKKPTKMLPLDRFFERVFRMWKSGTDDYDGNLMRNLNEEIHGLLPQQPVAAEYHWNAPPHSQHHHPPPHHPPPHDQSHDMHHQNMYGGSHHNWQENSNHQTNNIPRIRGGGEEEQSIFSRPLKEMPLDQWVGQAIYGRCTRTRGTQIQKDVFIGRVESVATDPITANGSSQVVVNVFYVSSYGKLGSKRRQVKISPSKAYLIPNCDQNSSDETVIENYNILTGENQTFTEATHSEVQRQEFTNGSNLPEERLNLIEAPKKRRLSSCSLGVLPDGKIVHWFSCDPAALYLRKSDDTEFSTVTEQAFLNHVRSFSNRMKQSSQVEYNLSPCDKMHCCIWGCTRSVNGNHKDREILGFDSEEELDHHLNTYHSYSPISPLWARVEEGNAIIELCADLTSHMCAKSWALSRFCTSTSITTDEDGATFSRSPFARRVLFDTSKVMNLYKNSEYKKFRRQGLVRTNVHYLMKLWFKICQLFEIESKGAFRQTAALIHYQCVTAEGEELDRGESDENHLIKELESKIDSDQNKESQTSFKIPLIKNATTCLFNKVNPIESLNCQLCRTSGENVIRSHGSSERYHGTGCGLLFDLCGNEIHNTLIRRKLVQAINDLKVLLGEINEIKVLLMKVASNVPSLLYLSQSKQKSKHEQHQIWSDQDIEVWIRFVHRCINTKMLAQAYIMLVNSINSNKMPMWWKASKSGWGSSFAIMQMPSLSSVALHLYTLDAAVAGSCAVNRQIHEKFNNNVDENQTNLTADTPVAMEAALSPEHRAQSREIEKANRKEIVKATSKEIEKVTRKESQRRDISTGTNNYDSEYNSGTTIESPKPVETRVSVEARESDHARTALSLQLKMKVVVLFANENGVKRFNGNSHDECLRCADGGDLLLCEFCPNVVHQECIGYDGDTNDLEYVCDDCINKWLSKIRVNAEKDVAKMKKVIQWANEEQSQRYIGQSNDDCYKCGEGGQILLCELCPRGVHQECIGYEGSLDDFDYVCRDCVEVWYSKKGYSEIEKEEEVKKYVTVDDISSTDSSPLIVRVRLDTGTDNRNAEEEMKIEEDEEVAVDRNSQKEDLNVDADFHQKENLNEEADSEDNVEMKSIENDDSVASDDVEMKSIDSPESKREVNNQTESTENYDSNHSKGALVDYLKSQAKKETEHGIRCKSLLQMSSADQMKFIVACADEMGIPRFDEEHHDYCTSCGNGEGDTKLYLCEFCENGFHRECLSFTGNMDDIDYVCTDCVIDLLQSLAQC